MPKNLFYYFSEQVAVSLAFALTVLFALSFVPASFVIFLVEERTSKAKHLQFVSGVKPTTFWFASYSWDVVCNRAMQIKKEFRIYQLVVCR
jgi:ABC-2 family transporter protein